MPKYSKEETEKRMQYVLDLIRKSPNIPDQEVQQYMQKAFPGKPAWVVYKIRFTRKHISLVDSAKSFKEFKEKVKKALDSKKSHSERMKNNRQLHKVIEKSIRLAPTLEARLGKTLAEQVTNVLRGMKTQGLEKMILTSIPTADGDSHGKVEFWSRDSIPVTLS